MAYYSFNGHLEHNKNNWFEFKAAMKLAGWTVPSSSDGLTYNAAGDQITVNATSGAGGVGNSSWYILTQPILDGYQRHWCFQFDSFGSARIKISWSGFSSGSPGITRVPSAADEQVLLGSGTDASPSYGLFFNSTQGLSNIFVMCGDATEKYSFYMFCVNSINISYAVICMEYLIDTHVLDIDPYVYGVTGNSNFNSSGVDNPWTISGSSQCSAWYKKGLSGEAFVRMPCGNQGYSGGHFANNGIGTNIYDNSIDIIPLSFFRSNNYGTQLGWKGTSTHFYIPGLGKSPITLMTKNTLNDLIYFSHSLVMCWDGSAVTLL